MCNIWEKWWGKFYVPYGTVFLERKVPRPIHAFLFSYTQTHTHTHAHIPHGHAKMGSEANQRNKRIFRIFVIFVKLPLGNVDHVPANVAKIKNKWLQILHPGVCHNVLKTESFSFIYNIYIYIYILHFISSSVLVFGIFFYHVLLLLYELKYPSACLKIYDLVRRMIVLKV